MVHLLGWMISLCNLNKWVRSQSIIGQALLLVKLDHVLWRKCFLFGLWYSLDALPPLSEIYGLSWRNLLLLLLWLQVRSISLIASGLFGALGSPFVWQCYHRSFWLPNGSFYVWRWGGAECWLGARQNRQQNLSQVNQGSAMEIVTEAKIQKRKLMDRLRRGKESDQPRDKRKFLTFFQLLSRALQN